MSKSKKHIDPSAAFLRTMVSLYFPNRIKSRSWEQEAASLPPLEAMVLGLMCLNNVYTGDSIFSLLSFWHRIFSKEEASMLSEEGILGLVKLGYLKPASKKAADALEKRNHRVWGLGSIPFVVTAKGAKRISHVVGAHTDKDAAEVAKAVQAKSKEAAKSWVAV